ncbi:MAG TPA: cyclic nucleotide-binding domain-containing protein, partial [Nannocystis sp.]
GFAHARGVLHCDIKSANVMVGEFGQVYLMDWGGAQLLPPRPGVDTRKWVRDSLPPLPPADTKGLVFGTPAYMSPEQASAGRDPMDERSDIFSMGALLYEIMTGKPPFQAMSPMEGIMLAQICDIPAPDELPEVPPNTFPAELVRIVMKALAKRPDDRYRSVAEMKLAILRLMRGGGNFATVRFSRGTHVIRQGEVGDAAYIVVSGKLEVYKTIDGERISLRQLGPGDMFGETAIFAASPRTASVVVTADASMVVVTRDVIEQELDSMKPWMGAFIRTLATRFGGVEEERRARSHSGPSMSAVGPISPETADASLRISPLNQRPGRPVPASPAPTSTRPASGPTAAVFQDRSDITRVSDLASMGMPDPRREGPRAATGAIGEPVFGESVMIDLSDVDDPVHARAETTLPAPTSRDAATTTVESIANEASEDDADTRLISADPRKSPR